MLVETMFNQFFSRSTVKDRAPENVRIYAIGDIHGCLDLLDDLLSIIKNDAKTSPKEKCVVFLGDYVDRGGDSKGVIDRLIDIKNNDKNSIFLKGNHEDALLNFLCDPEPNEDWLHWGGDATLESYGIKDVWRRDARDLAAEFEEKISLEHFTFLDSLDLYKILGNYLFVHAGIKPGVATEDQDPKDLLWIRQEFHSMHKRYRPNETIVHGHHPTKKPLDLGWRIAVDTGAVFTGILSAAVLDDTQRYFLKTVPKS